MLAASVCLPWTYWFSERSHRVPFKPNSLQDFIVTLTYTLTALAFAWSLVWSIPWCSDRLRAIVARGYPVVAETALPKADAIVVLGGGQGVKKPLRVGRSQDEVHILATVPP